MANQRPRKFKFIGCEIVYREACYLAATGVNHVDVEFLQKGLHDLETANMVTRIQQAIDAVDPDAGYEAIILGYARCNDGLAGITARSIPLVLPRAHDCITLFFGSNAAYREYFDEHPGTYYMTTGWSERNDAIDGDLTEPAYGMAGVMDKLGLSDSYEQMVEKYGEENAKYIAETVGDWTNNYSRMLYLEMGVCDESSFIDDARKIAEDRHWEFEQRKGGMGLLERLFAGAWNEDFLIVQPGQKIIARNDERIIDVE